MPALASKEQHRDPAYLLKSLLCRSRVLIYSNPTMGVWLFPNRVALPVLLWLLHLSSPGDPRGQFSWPLSLSGTRSPPFSSAAQRLAAQLYISQSEETKNNLHNNARARDCHQVSPAPCDSQVAQVSLKLSL